MTHDVLLEVEGLTTEFFTRGGTVHAVDGVSLSVRSGSTLAVVGESGSGKSVTAMSILGLIRPPGRVVGGTIRWKGKELSQAELAKLRGREISVVFQDPMTSLNPLMPVGKQVGETLRRHQGRSKAEAEKRVLELFDLVGINDPRRRAKQYPHEFSGGMRQRVMIAMALACDPDLLIADEPTTALDVTIQAQILELLAELQRELGLAVMLITHDLGVVAGVCQELVVMYAGRVMERGPVHRVFKRPEHPYTQGLLASSPRVDAVGDRLVGIDGAPPDLINRLPGCPFAPRCAHATAACDERVPVLAPVAENQEVACIRALTVNV